MLITIFINIVIKPLLTRLPDDQVFLIKLESNRLILKEVTINQAKYVTFIIGVK